MKGWLPAHKAESRQKAIKTEDVITVQVADKDMIYPAEADPVFAELHLGSFSAVN
jgi:hypothetical protein